MKRWYQILSSLVAVTVIACSLSSRVAMSSEISELNSESTSSVTDDALKVAKDLQIRVQFVTDVCKTANSRTTAKTDCISRYSNLDFLAKANLWSCVLGICSEYAVNGAKGWSCFRKGAAWLPGSTASAIALCGRQYGFYPDRANCADNAIRDYLKSLD